MLIPDEDVLTFAVCDNRVVITLNRQDFIRLHKRLPNHMGIIVCTNDTNRYQMATRINEAITASEPLQAKLIRVVRSAN
ncbi:DUF5615 family PIN-like protein [Nostoc sp.]|uniref:DUF5615 family PIN-like protein n=1 Tax=Nostoc sp. TaxID=1180 RepID=UPI0035943F86